MNEPNLQPWAMRLAYVQLGGGFPSLEAQVLRVMPLRPDDYTIEESPTDAARRRVCERLERLGEGDQLCVPGLDVFFGPAKEVAMLLSSLLARGVVVETIDDYGDVVEIGRSKADRLLMSWLRQMFTDHAQPPRRRAAAADLEVLSETDVAEIRRLARSGVTLRRIGMIFRRSPKCIEDVLTAGVPDLEPSNSDAPMRGDTVPPLRVAHR